jgi:small-conductance mechanosensitive channel
MSAESSHPTGSVTEWAKTLFVRFLALTLVFGVVLAVSAAPALAVLGRVSELALAFGALTTVGIFLPLLDLDFDPEQEDVLNSTLTNILEAPLREKFLYVSTYLLVLVTAMSTLVAVTGLAAATVATASTFGVVGAVIALGYPAVDMYVGQTFGWNIASTGGFVAAVVLYLIALGYHTEPTIPRQAATDARQFLLTH